MVTDNAVSVTPDAAVRAPTNPASVLGIFTTLIAGRRTIVLWSAALALIVVSVTLLMPATYTTIVSFTPTSTQLSGSQLAGLASQFGFSLPSGLLGGGQSPDFYGDLIQTPEMLSDLSRQRYTYLLYTGLWPLGDTLTVSQDLVDVYDITKKTYGASLTKAAELLGDHMDVDVGRETGVVRVKITTYYPDLSAGIGDHLLSLINHFNESKQKTQARAERVFLEQRLGSLKMELRQAQDHLEEFLIKYRSYLTQPDLVAQHDRLQREADLLQSVVSSLALSYEQTRMEEARNTPTITVVEDPTAPSRPDKRHLLLKAIVAMVVGFVAACAWLVLREAVVSESSEADLARYASQREGLVRTIRRLAATPVGFSRR
ncbi:MAG TPA: hypothetical protein VF493_21970 [Terriglobales bacterium]